jgi:hypothetical protein
MRPLSPKASEAQPFRMSRELQTARLLDYKMSAPIAVRSLISAIGMLNELLVDPTVSIVAAPHLAADEAPRYRSPRDNHGP